MIRRHRTRPRLRLAIGFGCAITLAACAGDSHRAIIIPPSVPPVVYAPPRPVVQPVPAPAQPMPPPPPIVRPVSAPSPALVSVIESLGRNFPGHVGIAVSRVDAGWTTAWNGGDLMPQQSVSKLWVAMTLLDLVDRGKLSLDDKTTITRADLVVFHQPSAANIKAAGWTTTLRDLLHRAMTESDNLANDTLLRIAGGPDAVRSYLARRTIADIRFGPGERLLQATTAGLEWRQDYANGRNFEAARGKLPMAARNTALNNYLKNPPDGASAAAIVKALAKLVRGEMLSPGSTRLLLSEMEEAHTGPQRVKGGVPKDWRYAHKTGTGQNLGGRTAGFNDVGLMTAPDGTVYAVAVMIGDTTQPIPKRWDLMQAVSRAVAENHRL